MENNEEKKVEINKQVEVEYVGTFDDGSVFDSSEGKPPLKFVIGYGQVVKGFEDALIGMKIGEEKTIHLEPKDAYGERDERFIQKVPKSAIPSTIDLKEGISLALKAPTGQIVPGKVIKIDDKEVTLDLNHPLAGKSLNFKIKVVSIEDIPEGHNCSTCGGCS